MREKSIQRQIAVDLSDAEQLLLFMDLYTAYRHEKRATDVEYLKRFIDAGAKLNYRSFFLARTPLHLATKYRDARIVSLLISEGAFVNARDRFGKTALDYAIVRDCNDVLEVLRRAGASSGEWLKQIERVGYDENGHFRLVCKTCGFALTIPREFAGRTGSCNRCKGIIRVPK